MPIVRAYIVESKHDFVVESKLIIACEEIVASALHIDGEEGNLTPFDIIVIPQVVEHMPLDVVIDIEAMPYLAREVGKDLMTEAILDSINLLLDDDLQIGVGLKLVLHAWASTTDDNQEPYGQSMSLAAALDRARTRIAMLDSNILEDADINT